jgi:alanine racemase
MTIANSNQAALEAVWRIPGRGARILVDLDAIEQNVAAICANVSALTQVMAIVKAGGYGHGGPLVAGAAIAGGATRLGVATISEGIELRQAGIDVPILVLGPVMPAEAPGALDHRLQITIGSMHQHEALCRELHAHGSGSPLEVQLKINTGMNRYGVNPEQAVDAARSIEASRVLALEGVFTHFARADDEDEWPTRRQAEVFRQCLAEMERAGVKPGLVHASNSAATFRFREYDFDMVRLGIGIYGVRPGHEVELFPGMRLAMLVSASVHRLQALKAGDSVGYGGTYMASEGERVGLLSLGYGDGYPRSLSNKAWVGFRGARLPVVGRISMDQTTIGVPPSQPMQVGDLVSVAGDGSGGEPTVEQLAGICGTIPYEILTSLGLRLPAFFVRSDRVVAHSDNTRATGHPDLHQQRRSSSPAVS